MLISMIVKFDPLEVNAKDVKAALVTAGLKAEDIKTVPHRASPETKAKPKAAVTKSA